MTAGPLNPLESGTDGTLPAEITLVLRPYQVIPRLSLGDVGQDQATPSHPPPHYTPAEYASRHAARPDDIALVHKFAQLHQLSIVETDPLRRTIRLSGSLRKISAAFLPEHSETHKADGTGSLASAASLPIPSALSAVVETALGYPTHHVARRHRTLLQSHEGKLRPLSDLARAYDFPRDVDGSGQTVGLIELGGGFHIEDIDRFCKRNGLSAPRITIVDVQGGANSPALPHAIHELIDSVDGQLKLSADQLASPAVEAALATMEVTMDLEILAALAPGADLVVYFAHPDEQGIYHALSRAVHDLHNQPDILSISWGEAEIALSDPYLKAIDQLLLTACHLGITVCASSGDAGAINNSPDHLPAVNFPASSPHCLSCGGTTTHFSGEHGAIQITQETVWNSIHFGNKGATGGGVSRKFGLPKWQQNAKVPLGPTGNPGRGVPDVSGPADPRYGWQIEIAGRTFSSAGTSAVAPTWAALTARCNQALGHRCGLLNPHLYEIGHRRLAGLRPVIQGHNDAYEAGPGWDACTGYGTPVGTHLLNYLRHLIGPKNLQSTHASE